jgi:hypothetical protein
MQDLTGQYPRLSLAEGLLGAAKQFGCSHHAQRFCWLLNCSGSKDMRDIYLGDSYDLVKRFWAQILGSIAPIYAHDRFVPTDLRERFSSLTTIPILDPEQLPEKPFGILLDPHTGIQLPDAKSQKVSIALAPVSFIAEQFTTLKPLYMACFDQTHDRHRSKVLNAAEQREAKRDSLLATGIYSFYYLSHAPFLFMAKDIEILSSIRNKLVANGIPEQTPSTIRLQPIKTYTPEPDVAPDSSGM